MKMMSGRREFLRLALLGNVALSSTSLAFRKRKPLLSFATLGCPDWSLDRIIGFATQYGYNGIEFRGLQRQFDLTKHPAFSNDEAIHAARQLAQKHRISIAGLGSSAVLHHREQKLRKQNIEEAKRFVDLSQKLDCPFVRVFPDKYAVGLSRKESWKLIADGLSELADYATGKKVTILLSTHGDVVTSDDINSIMLNVPYKNVGVGWDILNTWYENHVSPAATYREIKEHIKLVHVKDMSFKDAKEKNVLLGRGEVPVFEGVDALLKDGYDGYFSFVWEKRWFPEIEEPEIAFADFIQVMNKYLNDRDKS